MNVIRPPGGFRVTVDQGAASYIEAEAKDNFRVTQCWSDLLARIALTGLREGVSIPSDGPPRFTFIADGAPAFSIPTIQIVYHCRGDNLHIHAALIIREDGAA